jgi:hypothetical protein
MYKFEYSQKDIESSLRLKIEKEIDLFCNARTNIIQKDIDNYTRNRNYVFSIDDIKNIIIVYINK